MNTIWQPCNSYSPARRGVGSILGIVIHDGECPETSMVRALNSNGASAGYSIGEDGTTYQHVQDSDVAYHVAAWGNDPSLNRNRPSWLPPYNGLYSAINAATIGVELAGYAATGFTDPQYVSLGRLIREKCAQYDLEPSLLVDAGADARIVSHGWLQTNRTDPGALFDWNRLRSLVQLTPDIPQEVVPMLTDEELASVAQCLWGDTPFVPDFGIPRAWITALREGRYLGKPRGGEQAATDDLTYQEFDFGVAVYRKSDGLVTTKG